jgi:outer membrane protein
MRIIGILFVSSTLASVTLGPAGAQEVQELTATESVRLGLERNPRLQAALAEAAAAREVQREARGALLPRVRSQIGYTRLGGEIPRGEFMIPGLDTAITILPIEVNRYHTELSVEQPLFTGFRLQNRVRSAGHEAAAAALMAEQEAADVAFEIRRAYWSLTSAVAVRETLDGALVQVEEHVRNVTTRVEAGAALAGELLTAQTRRSEVMLERVEAENAVRLAQLELSRLIGLPLGTQVRPVEDRESETKPFELEALTARAVEARPELSALSEQLRSLRAQLDISRGSRLPEVAFTGRYVYSRPNPYAFTEQDQFRGTWEAGIALQWGIWEGGQRQAQVRQLRARVQAAEARLAQAREQVAVEVARHYLESVRAAEAIEVAELNVRGAEETFRVVQQQFEEGVALSSQVLDAELALRAARSRHARALADQAIAGAALLQVEGEVW